MNLPAAGFSWSARCARRATTSAVKAKAAAALKPMNCNLEIDRWEFLGADDRRFNFFSKKAEVLIAGGILKESDAGGGLWKTSSAAIGCEKGKHAHSSTLSKPHWRRSRNSLATLVHRIAVRRFQRTVALRKYRHAVSRGKRDKPGPIFVYHWSRQHEHRLVAIDCAGDKGTVKI